MTGNSMSLKSIVNNIAKKNKVSAQSVLQTYMLERLLERISKSQYKDNFILKGGMLISAMLGIDTRTTMDMDTTIKGLPVTEENLTKIIKEICNLDINDGVTFDYLGMEKIRDNDDYNGFRVSFNAIYDGMPVHLKVDVTTGDAITYNEVDYSFNLMLEDRKINVWSYNLETVLAEKYESIIKRGVLGTRIRDFYDVYMLMKTQKNNINDSLFKEAIINTSKHRGSLDIIINDREDVIEDLKEDDDMKKNWERYRKNNFYAEDINYSDLMDTLEEVSQIIEKN